MAETKRQKLDRRLAELKNTRSTWETQWRDICDQILPYRAKWTKEDFRKGEAKDTKLINNTPPRSLRILAAGLMAGITSPSREWFRLTTSDKGLNEKHAVRSYLDQVERIIREVLAQSGWYQTLADGVYRDLGLIATAVTFLEEGGDNFLRFEALNIGEYYLDVSSDNVVDTIMRKRPMTVRQLAQRFGEEKMSPHSKDALKNGNLGMTVNVIQAVHPNDDWEPGKMGSLGMPFSSDWWEEGSPASAGFLHEGGYEEFPVLAPRWNPLPGEAYGRGGPGWEAKGDCKALQHLELRLARLVDKSSDPPMKASDAMKSARASLLPGDMTYVPNTIGAVYEPVMTVNPNSILVLQDHIARHENRIKEAFYVDLFTSLLNDLRSQRPTATEVEAREAEKMLQLGPLLENLNHGLLEPCIDRVFAILDRAGALPEPPAELINTEGSVRIEFVSIMHQAQKATGVAGIRELIMQTGNLVQIGRQDALDKLNVDEIVDSLADMLGVQPDLVMADEQVDAMRAQRAAQEQAQQQGDAMLAATQGMKNMGQTDPDNMREVADAISPVAAAQAGLQ